MLICMLIEIFCTVFHFYLLFQTNPHPPHTKSPLNNSVCMKKNFSKRNNSHICNEIISFFSELFFDKQWHVLSLYILVFFFCLFFLLKSIFRSESCAIFSFLFFFAFFYPCYFALFFENFNSCLLFRFSLDRPIDRRLYKIGRCLANSRYLLCVCVCFFLFLFR